MSEELTTKQRILIENVVQGMTHYEAYANAFSIKGKTKAGIEASVSEILSYPKCKAYREECEKVRQEAAIATREEILMFHTKVLRTPIGEAMNLSSELCQSYKMSEQGESYTMPSKQGACVELCKMQGFYEPEKIETTHAVDMSTVIALVASSQQ